MSYVGEQPQKESHQQDHEIMMPQPFLLRRGLRARILTHYRSVDPAFFICTSSAAWPAAAGRDTRSAD